MLLDFFGNGSCKSKITQLYLAVFIDEDIPRLDISVHDSRLMDQVNGAQNVVYDCYDMLFSKLHFVRHIQYLCHILVLVFHD